MELNKANEHFVDLVVIDGDKVHIVCSCGNETKEFSEPKKQDEKHPGAEQQAREEHAKHYEDVMR